MIPLFRAIFQSLSSVTSNEDAFPSPCCDKLINESIFLKLSFRGWALWKHYWESMKRMKPLLDELTSAMWVQLAATFGRSLILSARLWVPFWSWIVFSSRLISIWPAYGEFSIENLWIFSAFIQNSKVKFRLTLLFLAVSFNDWWLILVISKE